MSNNVSIMSLLSGDEASHSSEPARADPTNSQHDTLNQSQKLTSPPLKSLISKYQTAIKIGDGNSVIEIDSTPVPELQPSPLPRFEVKTEKTDQNIVIDVDGSSRENTPLPSVDLSQRVSKLQTQFQIEVPKKTSIMSIMNYDKPLVEEVKEVDKDGKPVKPPAKKRVVKKPETKKTDPKKQDLKWRDPTKPDSKKGEKRKLDKKTVPDKKPVPNKKRKTPEPSQIKPKEVANLPPPEIIDVGTSEPPEEKDVQSEQQKSAQKEKDPKDISNAKAPDRLGDRGNILEPEKKEQKELPIIALNIPLLDPKNPRYGESEVVVNVLKLAEDKYGWGALHPNAKSALDVMDDIIDDDDDNEDDDNEEEELDKRKKEENLTEEQLIRQHQTKMNRKVGKYDYEDPFIDDDELQWEEKLSSTKEGFFVYWGPLIGDRNIKKAAKKR